MVSAPDTVEKYIASFPDDVAERLREIRRRLLLAVPGADEKIRYGMPAVMLGGRYAIHYAGWKRHIGLYPVADASGTDPELEAELAPLRSGADSINLSASAPIDYDLVERIGRFCAARRATSS